MEKNLEELSNGLLMAELDDVVQQLAKESNVEWVATDETHRAYRALVSEITKRLHN